MMTLARIRFRRSVDAPLPANRSVVLRGERLIRS